MIKDKKLKAFIEEKDIPINNIPFGELSNDKVEDMEKLFKRMAEAKQVKEITKKNKQKIIEIIDNSKYEFHFIDFLMKSKQYMNPESVEFIMNNAEEFQKFFSSTVLHVTETLSSRISKED